MSTLLVLILAFIVLDIVAVRWGVDSRERFESKEWEYRRHWMLGSGQSEKM